MFRRAQTASPAVSPMSGSPTFDTEKKGKKTESPNLQLHLALRAGGVINLVKVLNTIPAMEA